MFYLSISVIGSSSRSEGRLLGATAASFFEKHLKSFVDVFKIFVHFTNFDGRIQTGTVTVCKVNVVDGRCRTYGQILRLRSFIFIEELLDRLPLDGDVLGVERGFVLLRHGG